MRSTYAADDFDVIRTALVRIRDEATPRCPMNDTTRSLHACLRSPSRCPENCPHYTDWIGPEEKMDAQNAAAGAYC